MYWTSHNGGIINCAVWHWYFPLTCLSSRSIKYHSMTSSINSMQNWSAKLTLKSKIDHSSPTFNIIPSSLHCHDILLQHKYNQSSSKCFQLHPIRRDHSHEPNYLSWILNYAFNNHEHHVPVSRLLHTMHWSNQVCLSKGCLNTILQCDNVDL